MLRFNHVARDNTYNNENDFSNEFTWSIWTREDDTSDWCWNSEEAYVAICRHRGGDVRGNYGPVTVHRVFDCIAESGFLDWVLGWHVSRFSGDARIDLEHFSEANAKWVVDHATEDERLTERCSPGYASLPSSELWDEVQDDRCYWHEGVAIMALADGSGYLAAKPYHDSGTDIAPHENGLGWLCDAEIDTNQWIAETLGDDILDDLAKWGGPTIERWIAETEWDHDDSVGKLCGADQTLQYCEGGAA